MHALLDRTRSRLSDVADDLRVAAGLLDADADRLHDAVEQRGVPGHIDHAWSTLPARADRAGAVVASVLLALAARLRPVLLGALARLDAAALRVEALRPVLIEPGRARRLAHTLAASSIILTLTATMAFATMAGPRKTVQVDRLADGEAPARQQALAALEGNLGAAARLRSSEPARGVGAVAASSQAAAETTRLPRTIPAQRGALPVGKSMWIWLPERAEGGNADAIVAKAKATGLQNLYVRTSSYKQGFIAADFLNRLLPRAHAAGIRVYAWDFPYLDDVQADINQALQGISYLTPDGHRVDGYTADIELQSEGVNITPQSVSAFGAGLRKAVGAGYPLIATVPRPSVRLVNYPFPEIAANFDALAPMVYWLGQDPALVVTDALARLAPLGKPVIPVGQAYDGGAEGGPAGVPPRAELLAFMTAAEKAGAVGVSWWSWQHATPEAWQAVKDGPEFTLPAASAAPYRVGQVRAYQTLLTSLGFPAPVTGVWDLATAQAVANYQRAARLPITGVVDGPTRDTLFTPFPPPIRPTP
jgi:hypothetical protein